MPQARSSNSRSPTDTRSGSTILRSFLLHLASERGLADNSLHAYRRDLEDLGRNLADAGLNFLTAEADHFRAYLQDQSRHGKSTRTVSRRLAAIRAFLRFLTTQGYDRL